MTDREKAIVMAHTQVATLAGDDLSIYYSYVEEILGRPVLTHELGVYADEIIKKSKPDFIKICKHKQEDR